MSATASFYIMGDIMELAAGTSSLGSSTSHPIASGLDWNLDTYYEPADTVTTGITINLGSAKTVEGVAFWEHDYDTGVDAQTLQLFYSDDGASFTSATAVWGIHAVGGATGDPLKIFPESGHADPHQYWRFVFGGSITQRVHVSQFMLFKHKAVGIGNSFPEVDVDQFHNKSFRPSGGTRYIEQFQRRRTKRLQRRWRAAGSSDFTIIRDSIRDSFGMAFPLIFNESGSNTLVRFAQDKFTHNQFDYLLYDIAVVMEEVPYIEDGQTF